MSNHSLLASAIILLSLNSLVLAQSGQSTNKNQPPSRPKTTSTITLPGPGNELPQSDKKSGDDALRIESNLVTVIASIKPPANSVAEKLVESDFEILQDGVPQELASFARDEDVPLRLIMLFDTSSSVKSQLRFERRAAARFFEKLLRPQDQAALFAVSTDVTIIQDFTNNVRSLTDATKLLQAKGATSLYDAIFLASGYLKLAKGRRIIVLVTDGGDTTSMKKLTDALQQAQESDVVIFNVFTGVIASSQNIRDLAAERAMQALTSQTGGEVYTPQMEMNGTEIDEEGSLKNLDAAFSQLADQLRTQYTLRFYSSNDQRDGKYRKISVRVKKAGYSARARSGYYAPKG